MSSTIAEHRRRGDDAQGNNDQAEPDQDEGIGVYAQSSRRERDGQHPCRCRNNYGVDQTAPPVQTAFWWAVSVEWDRSPRKKCTLPSMSEQ